jgi:hypothetical protein
MDLGFDIHVHRLLNAVHEVLVQQLATWQEGRISVVAKFRVNSFSLSEIPGGLRIRRSRQGMS